MYPTLSENTKMNNKYFINGKSHAESEILWETFYYQEVMYNGAQK